MIEVIKIQEVYQDLGFWLGNFADFKQYNHFYLKVEETSIEKVNYELKTSKRTFFIYIKVHIDNNKYYHFNLVSRKRFNIEKSESTTCWSRKDENTIGIEGLHRKIEDCINVEMTKVWELHREHFTIEK
jgi:hypothetical protein